MTRRSWTLLIVIAVVAFAGALAVRTRLARGTYSGPQRTVRLYREPMAIPTFTVTDLDGRAHSSTEWAGKVVVVNFWATWCPPCRAEIPDLIALQKKYGDRLVVVGISQDEGPIDAVKQFAAEQQMNYTVAMTTPEIQKIFRGVVALPTTFIVGPDGKVQQKHVGMLNAAETEAEAEVLAGIDTHALVERIESSDKVRLANAAQAKTLPGVDLTSFTDEQRKPIVQALIDADCTCGCSLTVAECRLEDPDCPISLPLAKKIVEQHTTTQ